MGKVMIVQQLCCLLKNILFIYSSDIKRISEILSLVLQTYVLLFKVQIVLEKMNSYTKFQLNPRASC